ncbi:Ankyrin_repeat-containing domain superfamily [Hexamita inflata]|uniref:Ankyrin repeat-containing domain superfamily n=1 Tax=Hexamita inflata TaxID=28002 RepID=A0AA86U777_9EUKA|nr:Ankyrin repeat-containing domain superfamily [Hexamita inflata]
MNKQTTHWMDLVPLLPQTVVKQNFMVYFCNKIPLIFQNNQIMTVSGQILLNDIQSVQYNNLTSEVSDRKSECIVQQNNQYFALQLNYDEMYQLKAQLSEIENITQPDCQTFSSEIQWEEFLQKTVQNFINTQYKKEEFWNFYTDVVHPGVFVCQPVELINIIEEISINSFKNIDNAVKYLQTQSDQLLKISFFICSQINVFDFIFSNLYEVIVEIFNRSNTSVLQIIKVLFWLNKIDEAIELVNQSQSLQAYEEFLNYLNLTYDNCKLSLAKYQYFISNFYLIFQDNLPNLDFQNIFATMFVYHLMIYGTEQINISFDPNIKLYIGKHNDLYIQDYATQLQVAILCSYNKYVDYFISQKNEVSKLGFTCFQIAIMGGNTEMIVKFKDQIQIQTYHITSLMLLMTTYQESIPDTILERLIELQAGMISKNKLCALQLFLQQPKQISLKYIKLLLEKEFKLISFSQITEFMTFLSLKQFQYLSQLNFVDGISVSEAILFTIIQHNIMYPAFQFVNIDIKRNTRFRPICAKHLTHDHIKLLFQHFSFSLSHDIAFLNQVLLVQTNLKPIQSCLKNNLNQLRGFSCYDFAINLTKIQFASNQFKKVIDFAINLMKIQQEKDFKKVDYFFKPIVAFDSFDGADIFSRNNQDHTKLFCLVNDLWQSE